MEISSCSNNWSDRWSQSNLIIEKKINLMIPHMSCISSMTDNWSLFDLLQIPYLGNNPDWMSITSYQAKIKGIVAVAGVNVSPGEVLRRGEKPTICPPVVVKPADADHSWRMSLSKNRTNLMMLSTKHLNILKKWSWEKSLNLEEKFDVVLLSTMEHWSFDHLKSIEWIGINDKFETMKRNFLN